MDSKKKMKIMKQINTCYLTYNEHIIWFGLVNNEDNKIRVLTLTDKGQVYEMILEYDEPRLLMIERNLKCY